MKIAVVQMDILIGEVSTNLKRVQARLTEAAQEGAGLVIFPECALPGYCFESREEAWDFAEEVPGASVNSLVETCRQTDCHAVVGMLERDGELLYNTAVLVGPEGLVAKYRKIHLPDLGVDRFTDYGPEPFAVHDVHGVKIGMNICYDSGFPESSRIMTLLGADLIVLPTNWPPGAECLRDTTVQTRAVENAVYYAVANRVGVERDTPFIGGSKICDPKGDILAAADNESEAIIYAEIDVEKARRKHIIRKPGHEINRLADRRPEMYGLLTEVHELLTPRQMRGR